MAPIAFVVVIAATIPGKIYVNVVALIVYRALRRHLAVIALLIILSTVTAHSQCPVHYYDNAIGKTGVILKSALHDIIKNHTVLPYTANGTDTWDALKILDEAATDSAAVWLIYSGFTVDKSAQYTGSTGSGEREHLWPQSYGIIARSGNSRAKTDLFNLRPIDATVNRSRGNKYYDTSTTPVSSHPEAPASSYDSDSWEPRDADKGAIARTMFYMALRYDGADSDVPDLELSDVPDPASYRFGKLSTMLRWNQLFPVEIAEGQRNDRIYVDYQHNRNPFIDQSEYADMIFNGVSFGTAWRSMHFATTELADQSISGDGVDFDEDGISNLLEYVFNRDPRLPEQASPISYTFARDAASNESIILACSQNRNATDVQLTFERTTDLKIWQVLTPEVVSVAKNEFRRTADDGSSSNFRRYMLC